MQLKNKVSLGPIILIAFSSFVCFVYLLLSLAFFLPPRLLSSSSFIQDLSSPTSLQHIVFGIASCQKSWLKSKEYVKLWWRPREMRGCVFLETVPQKTTLQSHDTAFIPPVCIYGDASGFRYTYRGGDPSAIRVARVVSEIVNLNYTNVRWFVFAGDDTVFFPDNLVKTLSKYDHGLWYYIGTNSESYMQNKFFSHEMAFAGAGFALSYPLARVLAKVLDSCLKRYPHLYGSDGRVHACLAELGVVLTHEPGFHQMDVIGSMFGILAAHPLKPIVSLHNMDAIDPIFPNMTAMRALEHLVQAAKVDPHRILHQTVCYDRWYSWTISVSWGYVVQLYASHLFVPDALRVPETYIPWKRSTMNNFYGLDTIELHPDPCRRPTSFFMDKVLSNRDGITSTYKRMTSENCTIDATSPRKIEEIRVFSKRLDLTMDQLQAPRRQCCEIMPSTSRKVIEIRIRECEEEELVQIHP